MHRMSCLPRLHSVNDAEITIEKLDKVAKSLSDRIKGFAKFFGIILGWSIFNLIIALFIDRTRSLSLDSYRMVTEGLRDIATQDFFFVLTLFFENKICCVFSIAVLFVFETAFFVRFLNFDDEAVAEVNANKRASTDKAKLQSEKYVVSYKQQVAFLA